MTTSTPTSHAAGAGLDRFESAFRTHYEALRRYAYRAGAEDPDAIAGDSLAALWRRLEAVHPAAERAWLYTTARNLVANQRRAEGRRAALAEKLAATAPRDPLGVPLDRIEDRHVAGAFAALSPTDQEVLALAVWDELEAREIARVLGISRSAAGVRLHRARRRFRAAYEQLGASMLVPSPSTISQEGCDVA